MASENNPSRRCTLSELTQQFLLGTAFGVLLALIPLFYLSVSNLEVTSLYLELLAALVVTCGVLAALFGARFLQPLITFLKSIPPVG